MTTAPGGISPPDTLPTPLIIPRSEHPISRKNIDREALKVMYRLRDAGFTAYLVGGGVRDLYLRKTPKDFDISTNARPGQIRNLFRNSRIIGRRFRLVQVFFHGGKIIEVSTFRCRSEYDLQKPEEVLPSNNTFGNEADDAFRRDLTINALFYEIENFSIIDYTGGVEDLKKGIIRIVGDPDRRIIRDPVRIMRAIRHAARSGFNIEENTWEAIKRHREKLSLCPVSRIRDELFKDLKGGASKAWTELAVASGVFFVLFPFYEKIIAGRPEDSQPLKKMLKVLNVIDRLHNNGQKIPDEMLLAFLLVPWAQETLGLMSAERKGAEAFNFSRRLRNELDSILPNLNVNKVMKEELTALLTNLPLFQQFSKKKDWPKWLTRKSYYHKCLQFYRIYQEAMGGAPLNSLSLPVSSKKTKKRPPRRDSRTPAFTNKKGGVFGLRSK